MINETITFGETNWTLDEYDEFLRLVNLGSSSDQMDRIESRLEMPKFIKRVGKNRCDEMFGVMKEEGDI